MGNVEHTIHCVKSVRIRSYSGPHFPAFGLNTERCGVCGKMLTRTTPNMVTFYAVYIMFYIFHGYKEIKEKDILNVYSYI